MDYDYSNRERFRNAIYFYLDGFDLYPEILQAIHTKSCNHLFTR